MQPIELVNKSPGPFIGPTLRHIQDLQASGWVDTYEAGTALERGYMKTSFEHLLPIDSLPGLDAPLVLTDSQIIELDCLFEVDDEYEAALLTMDMPEASG
jgi:hypothetical protein